MSGYHRRFLKLTAQIEREFPVARWQAGDLHLWPLAKMALHLDMHRQAHGEAAPNPPGSVHRTVSALTRLPRNLWRSRHDLEHLILRPHRADVIFLGDGVSLDCLAGAYIDRFCEPLIAACVARGLATLMMQRGDLSRLPWARPTMPANMIGATAGLALAQTPCNLPKHHAILTLLNEDGIPAPSLAALVIAEQARYVLGAASRFERLLMRVRPRLAFVVNYYSSLAPAFLLACRRSGVLTVDLQHCPQDGAHKAYSFASLPSEGYAGLPDLFWTWREDEAAFIRNWAEPRHQAFCGGHIQLADHPPNLLPAQEFAREILVALQPIANRQTQWDALADVIAASPPDWHWWLRRHPSERPDQTAAYGRLLAMAGPRITMTGQQTLPQLLSRMTAMVSLTSGAAAEAEMMGVPALFLDDEADDPFAALIARGGARVVPTSLLLETVAALPARPDKRVVVMPPLSKSLDHVLQRAGVTM